MKKVLILTVMAFAWTAIWTRMADPAAAQYPPAPANVAVAAGALNTTVGGTVPVAATATDATGAPLGRVDCSFAVTSQPGTDARVDPTTDTTNDAGVATTTLHVGSAAGAIIIEADCDGASQTLTVVAGDEAAPPASQPDLPSTGLGAVGESGGPSLLLIAGAGFVLIAGGSGIAYATWRVRR